MANLAVYCIVFYYIIVHGFLQCSVTAQSTRVVDVQLTGGSSGTLQLRSLTPPTEWNDFPCVFNYDDSVFVVACRMLGFENITYVSRIHLSSSGNFLSMNQRCRGIETDINDCGGSYSFTSYCPYRYDIGCSSCAEGAVRLSNGLVPEHGIVEICINGLWHRVCGVNWGYQNSFVVCRQLGYPATKPDYKVSTYTGSHAGSNLFDNFYYCGGGESHLSACSLRGSTSQCTNQLSFPSVILHCRGKTVTVTSCTDGAIRLSGGRDQNEGRVEVCRNGLWGTVSRSSWDSDDAMVACRQLGLLQPRMLTRITMPSFGPGEGPIIFHGLSCTGSENSLSDCSQSDPYNIDHNNDAGVRCQFNLSPLHSSCEEVVRLVGGNSDSEGRVEMCYNGVWGSICSDGWSYTDAAVVCRLLGLQAENSTAINDVRYGEGSGPYLLSRVGCVGNERNLLACPHQNSRVGYHICSSQQDAGVICASTCRHGDIRLYRGYSKSEGLAEVCVNGQWTSMCLQGWNVVDSIKFCRELLERENVVTSFDNCCNRVRSTIINYSWNNVICDLSNLTRFINCSHNTQTSCGSWLTLGCYVYDNCSHGSLRLVNGSTMSEGIVEVCLNGVWGNILSGWNTPAAVVVCRQLGLSWGWSQYYHVNQRFDAYYSPHLLRNVNCVGDEDTLFNCTYDELPLQWSLHGYTFIAAVLCQGSANQSNNPKECISGEVRLANSSNNIEGRVEICTEGMWVSVCDKYWGIEETRAFCKQLLSRPAKGSFHVTGGYYGTGNSPIISRVNCYNSDSFDLCTITHQGDCSHENVVGVVCQENENVYAVTVTSTTDPPFEPGSNVELHCSVNPDPSVGRPVQLYYNWRGNNVQFFYRSTSNITVAISWTHYKASYYYCEVSVSGSVNGDPVGVSDSIGVGSILIQTTDILNPVEVFSQGDGQTFSLSVNATDEIQLIARELNWYINGNLITNSSDNLLTKDSKTLMTTVGSPGVYEVRYDGLLALPHNRDCEGILLSGMRHYPMFKPVRFLVNTTEDIIIPLSTSTITILSSEGIENVFTYGETINLRVLGQTSLSIDPRDIRIIWFINGIRQDYFISGQMYGGIISGELVLTNATYQFAGRCEVLLVWNIGSSQQCNVYYNLLREQTPFDLNEVILAKSSIELKYYESLDYSFTATKSSLSSSEVSLLTCSATIRYPPLTSISIVKNKIILKTTADTSLRVSTDSLGVSPFGSYQCRVNASGVPFIQQFMIKEKVSLRIEVEAKESLKCSNDDEFVEVMESSIATKLDDDCSCNVTTDDLRDTLIECNSESSVIFTTLLVFSTKGGDETASTLANRLSRQVSFSALTIYINGIKAKITSVCSDDCSQSIGRNLDSIGVIVGVVFGAMFLIAVCIIIFILFRRKFQKRSSPLTNLKSGEGDVRYDVGKSPRVKVYRKGGSGDNVVYDIPNN